MWYQNRTRYSSKVAVDISHFRLWQRLAASKQPAIILEDDVKLAGGNWTRHLLTVLNELPQVCLATLQPATSQQSYWRTM
jgi:hypothetical protein